MGFRWHFQTAHKKTLYPFVFTNELDREGVREKNQQILLTQSTEFMMSKFFRISWLCFLINIQVDDTEWISLNCNFCRHGSTAFCIEFVLDVNVNLLMYVLFTYYSHLLNHILCCAKSLDHRLDIPFLKCYMRRCNSIHFNIEGSSGRKLPCSFFSFCIQGCGAALYVPGNLDIIPYAQGAKTLSVCAALQMGNGSSVKVVYLELWDCGWESLPAHQMFPRVCIQEFSGKTLMMLFFDILIELYFIQPTLCQYISFQLCLPFFVEFRLGSKATHKLASLGYARIPCETTHRYKFSCFINDAKNWLSNDNVLLCLCDCWLSIFVLCQYRF